MSGPPPLGVCGLLPAEARELLVRAAAIPDPFARERAIDAAVTRLRARYPDRFRDDTALDDDAAG